MKSIRIIFPTLFALLILLSVGSVAFISISTQMKEAKETAGVILDLVVSDVEAELQNHLNLAYELTHVYAQEIGAYHLTNNDDILSPDFVNTMIKAVRSDSQIARNLNITFSNPNGQNLSLDSSDHGQQIVRLSDIRKGGEVKTFTYDNYGKKQPPISIDKIHYDPRSEIFYQRALEERGMITGGIKPSALAGGRLIASVAEPVFGHNNQLRMVVSSDIDLDSIQTYLQSLHLPEHSTGFLFNRHGKLLASTLPSAVAPSKNTSLISLHDQPDTIIHSAAQLIEKRNGTLDLTKTDRLTYQQDGQTLYTYVAPVKNRFHLGWNLAIVISESGLIDNLRKGIEMTALLTFALIIIAILVGLFLSSWMIKPIVTLHKAASALEHDQLTEPQLPINQLVRDSAKPNEFGRLAQVFIRMIDEIRTRNDLMQIQLDRLRHEVVDSETQSEIKRISDSPFFKDLKDKAEALRASRRMVISRDHDSGLRNDETTSEHTSKDR